MEAAGVKLGDSRDHFGLPRFFPLNTLQLIDPDNTDPEFWYWRNIVYKHNTVSLSTQIFVLLLFHFKYHALKTTLHFWD